MNSAILRINHSPADKYQGNQFRYPLDRDLFDGYRYPPFEQLGPQSCFRPRKLLYVYRVYNEDQSFNNFENDTMTLSVNEAKLVCELGTLLLFNNFDFKICPRARTVSEPCEKGALVAYSVYVSGQMTSKPNICPNKWSSWPQHCPLTGHYFERWRPRRFFNLNPCCRVLR